MTDGSGLGILTIDRTFAVRTWNQWLATATGVPEDRAIGRPLEDLAGGASSTWYREIFDEVLETGTTRVLAPAFHRFLIACPPLQPSAHFDRMQQRVTVAPLLADQQIVGLLITIDDVTARLEEERRLAAQLREGVPESALSLVGADDWRIRREAVGALRQSATPEDIKQLIQGIRRDHENLNVLSSALQVLVSANLDVAPPLISLLSDDDPNLRMHAALALGALRSEAAVPALIAALGDPDHNVRFHAIEALGTLRAPEAVQPLADIAGSGDFFLAFPAIDALGGIDDPRVASRLVGLLGEEDVRPAVVDTLAALGDEDSVPPLVALLNTGSVEAAAVAAALERIYTRYEDTYTAGAHIADLVQAAIEPAGVRHLAEALSRRATPLRPLVVVLGWVGAPAVDALVGALNEAEVQSALDAALMRVGRPAIDPLLARVESGARQERLAAAALLGRLGDRRAVPPLVDLLRSADADLVSTAAGALAVLGDPRALDELLNLFAHPLGSVRQTVIAAVNSIGAESTEGRVRALIKHPDPHVRESAIRVAGYFGFDDCVPQIVAAVRDEHEDIRRAAIEQLAVLEHPSAMAALVKALTDETPRNRAAAAHALRASDDPATARPLQAALADGDPWVRYFAAGSVARRRLTATVPDLVRLASGDPAAHVRIAALDALAAFEAPEAVDVAAALLSEHDSDLVGAALSALAGTADPRADDLIEGAVHSPHPGVRLSAVEALASRPGDGAVGALAWAARLDDPPALRGKAIDALGRIAAAGHLPAVHEILDLGAEAVTRDAALGALAALPEKAVATVAAGLAPGSRVAVRVIATEALGRMRHRRASEELTKALADEDPTVRTAAVTAFGRLGTPAAGPLIAELSERDTDASVRRHAHLACLRHGWRKGSVRP